MSVLLRHPATVPALFSRAVDPDPRSEDARLPWLDMLRRAPFAAAAAWIAVVLIDVPLVKVAVGLALPR